MIDTAIAVCRFLFDTAASFLWGSAVYLWLLVDPELKALASERLATIRWLAVAALLASTAAILPLRTAVLGGDWAAATDPVVLVAVVTATNIGTAWFVQVVAGGLLAVLLAIGPAQLHLAGTSVLGAILLASLSLTGHAAMNSGWIQPIQQLNNALHLLAAGFWIGALPVVLLLLPQLSREATRASAANALKHFSTAGHVAVTIVVFSGVASTMLIIGRFPPEPDSIYQLLLLVKIGLVATMILTAIVNRYIFVPRIRHTPDAVGLLAAGTLTEIALVAVVIALVAALGMLQPLG